MSPQDFCFWLHGFFELSGKDELTPEQQKMVREHLDLVFEKVTPVLGKPEQKLLTEADVKKIAGQTFQRLRPDRKLC